MLLGFVLGIVRDVIIARTESLARDKAVMNAINEDLLFNKRSLRQNLSRLHDELSVLDQNMTSVQPLFTMKMGFWDLAKVNLRGTLLAGDRLVRLRDLVFLAEQVNDEVRSRDNYRIHRSAASNYAAGMKAFDESLVRILNLLDTEMAAYEDQPKPATDGGTLQRLFGWLRSGNANSA